MRQLILIAVFLVSSLFGEESLSVKPTQDISFQNGFGTIYAKPVLNDKELQESVLLRGQYNVLDEQNNVEIAFDKVQYQGKVFDLSNPFMKKSRLRSRDVVLKRDSQFIVSGGDKSELLQIVNTKVEEEEDTTGGDINDKLTEAGFGGTSTPSATSGYGGSSGFTPTTTLGNTSSGNTWQPNNDATMVVDCPKPSYSGGMATYYVQQGTVCVKQTSNSAYEKYNTNSCRNKVDYNEGKITLGYEMYVTSPEGQEYLVQHCQYEEPITLKSEVGSCRATADFENNVALIEKQFYYTHNNEREDVGECTTTDITVPLEHDLNECTYDRHDFTAGYSYPQTQYFYRYENVKKTIGECVDAHEYKYKHYMDDTTCDWKVIDGRVFYRQRVAYDNLLGQKKFATDCETTSSGGMELHTEFAGYNFYDQSKQAIRKINTFFYVPDTTQKVYVDKNIETTSAYPYVEEQCAVENDDEALQTHFSKRIYINDTDKNEEVEVSPCQVHQTMPYQKLNTTEVIVETLENQLIEPDGSSYKILGTDKQLTGQPNWTRNTPAHTSPVELRSRWYNSEWYNFGATPSVSQMYNTQKNRNCTLFNSVLTRSGTIGDFSYNYKYHSGGSPATACENTFNTLNPQTVSLSISYRRETIYYNENSETFGVYKWTFSLKPGYADNQIIDVIESQQEYVRGDGTTYVQPGSGTLSYVAK